MSNNVTSADNQQERLKTIGWIVGFTDGEGCFSLSIIRNSTTKLGWQVMPEFILTQGEKSKASLELVRNFFGCGKIFVNRRHDNHKENLFRYCVRRLSDLDQMIIPFFKEYPLQTAKADSFQVWSEAISMMIHEKKHLDIAGIESLAYMSFKINKQKRPKFLESSETTRKGN